MTADVAEYPDPIETAIDWHLRQAELSADDWLAFVDWLEASPVNARAYDAVAADDRALAGLRGAVMPRPVLAPPAVYRAPPARKRWAWAGGAMAAGVAVMLAMPMLHGQAANPYSVATRAGEHLTVTLADATQVEMSGATRLVLGRHDMRVARLEAGEAVFHVRHDAAHPFTLSAGGRTIRDMGTVFDVALTPARVDVAVAEGSVAFEPGASAVVLHAGEALSAKGDIVARSQVSAETVGGWRSGRLSYNGAPLANVAAALERRYGTPVVLEGDLPDRPFTGTIRLSGSATRDIPHLAALLGADARRDGARWVLRAR